MRLGVYWDRVEVGALQRVDERSREFLFQHSDSPRMISLSLPISSEPFTPAQTRPFFEALLPEGAVRERIAVQLKLATSDSYSLLSELGRDCACALQIFEARRLSQTPSVHWLSRDKLDQLVEELMFARERGALVKRVLSEASLLRDEALQGRWHHPCIEKILAVIASRAERVAPS